MEGKNFVDVQEAIETSTCRIDNSRPSVTSADTFSIMVLHFLPFPATNVMFSNFKTELSSDRVRTLPFNAEFVLERVGTAGLYSRASFESDGMFEVL